MVECARRERWEVHAAQHRGVELVAHLAQREMDHSFLAAVLRGRGDAVPDRDLLEAPAQPFRDRDRARRQADHRCGEPYGRLAEEGRDAAAAELELHVIRIEQGDRLLLVDRVGQRFRKLVREAVDRRDDAVVPIPARPQACKAGHVLTVQLAVLVAPEADVAGLEALAEPLEALDVVAGPGIRAGIARGRRVQRPAPYQLLEGGFDLEVAGVRADAHPGQLHGVTEVALPALAAAQPYLALNPA